MTKRFLNPTFLFASADFILAAFSFVLVALLMFNFDPDDAARYIGPLAPRAIVYAFLAMVGLLAMGLYRARQRPRTWETVARVMLGVAIGGILFIMLFYLVPYLASGRGILLGSMAVTCLVVTIGRVVLLRFIDGNMIKARILVIGTGPTALKIGRLRRASDRRRYEVAGYVAVTSNDHDSAERHAELRPIVPIDKVIGYPEIDEVVVAMDERRGTLPVDLLLKLKGRGTPVVDVIDFLERETGKVDLDLLSPSWFVYTRAGYTGSVFRATKRLVDIALSALIFVLMSPVFALVIAAIWFEDGLRTPIMYRQSRVGRGGRSFKLLKFRSMSVDAEAGSGPQWARQGDMRVTRVGKMIRRFRIDELPQLFNVISGEMSIVGPRPERPEFVEMLSAEIPMYSVRHNMRPGLTGWAQLNFPYGASVIDAREKLSYDIAYIKNASLLLDLRIFLETIEVVIWGRAISMAGPPRPNDDPRDTGPQRRQRSYSRVSEAKSKPMTTPTPTPISGRIKAPRSEEADAPAPGQPAPRRRAVGDGP